MEPFLKPLLKFWLAFALALLLTLWSGTLTQTSASTHISSKALNSAQSETWVQQGTTLYETGQYQAAVAAWKQAAEAYQQQGDRLNQAVALSNLALTYHQLGDWTAADTAISASFQRLPSDQRSPTYGQILDIRGQLSFDRGHLQAALTDWSTAAAIYERVSDRESLSINQLNQAQALQLLGLLPQAERLLQTLQANLNQPTNSLLKTRSLRSLGQVYQKLGKLDEAQALLTASQQTAQQVSPPQLAREIAATWLSLGNVQRAIAERERETAAATTYTESTACPVYPPRRSASTAYEQAELSLTQYQKADQGLGDPTLDNPNLITKLHSQLNQLSLLRELQRESEALNRLPAITAQLAQTPPNRASVFAQINLAKSLMCFTNAPSDQTIAAQLATAIQQARLLNDQRAESYALGTLGHLYELEAERLQKSKQTTASQQQEFYARKLTEKALLIAQATNASEITYQWQWQLGRILKELPGETTRQQAINVYSEAVKTLSVVRSELSGTNPSVQFSFRDDAEPVYRELVDLLLSPQNSAPPDAAALSKAIAVIDSLQVAELENFFRCVLSQLVQVDRVVEQSDPTAAIFYPIMLPDRLEVILRLPGQSTPIHYSSPVARSQVERTLQTLRSGLVNPQAGFDEYEQSSRQVYEWLIRPAEAALKTAQAKTLVFVLDGSLRNIPMSALWDGQQFLIEQYAIAITPGFQLLGPKRLEPQQLRALIAGLTSLESGKVRIAGRDYTFNPLKNVQAETAKIKAVLPGSIELLGDQFQSNTLRQQLSRSAFPILHFSTHGNFGANPQETFILTAANQYLSLDDLQGLLRANQNRTAIELIVFSACETAKGDRHAALGMAGAAVRSGASSTLATLWAVDDASTTELMGQFYQNLKTVIEKRQGTKAAALRQSQLSLLKSDNYSSPYYWSPFILLGNWL